MQRYKIVIATTMTVVALTATTLLIYFSSNDVTPRGVNDANLKSHETIYFNNGIYTGYLFNSAPHGQGRLVFARNMVGSNGYYEGEFVYGQFHGFGRRGFLCGCHFIGEWFNGVPHGFGETFRCRNGSFFLIRSGYFEYGLLDGISWRCFCISCRCEECLCAE